MEKDMFEEINSGTAHRNAHSMKTVYCPRRRLRVGVFLSVKIDLLCETIA